MVSVETAAPLTHERTRRMLLDELPNSLASVSVKCAECQIHVCLEMLDAGGAAFYSVNSMKAQIRAETAQGSRSRRAARTPSEAGAAVRACASVMKSGLVRSHGAMTRAAATSASGWRARPLTAGGRSTCMRLTSATDAPIVPERSTPRTRPSMVGDDGAPHQRLEL